MIYRDFKGEKLSMLGFGTMRLPVDENKEIDVKLTGEMLEYALRHGVNYIDTAYPYMSSKSELVIGELLKRYPRDSFFLADITSLYFSGSVFLIISRLSKHALRFSKNLSFSFEIHSLRLHYS